MRGSQTASSECAVPEVLPLTLLGAQHWGSLSSSTQAPVLAALPLTLPPLEP